MTKTRKATIRKRKRRTIIGTTLKIAPIALAIALAGRWTWSNIGSDIKFELGLDDINQFLNNNQTIEEQVDEVVEENEKDSTVDEETEVSNELAQVSVLPPIDLTNIMNGEYVEKTSSELYDMDVAIPDVNWEAINEVNEDVNAWIQIPGTKVNNVIVQGTDNEYYLHHNYKNEDEKEGTVFIDWRDNPLSSDMSELSDVTTIYGHNQRSGRMFGTIVNYKSQAFYDRWPYGILTTEAGEVYKIDFFAGIIVDGNDEANVYIPDFIDEGEFKAFFDEVVANSLFTSDVNVEFGDKIIALSTCSYEYNNARFLLFGTLTKQLENTQEATNSLGL